jgi:hypothetical protein
VLRPLSGAFRPRATRVVGAWSLDNLLDGLVGHQTTRLRGIVNVPLFAELEDPEPGLSTARLRSPLVAEVEPDIRALRLLVRLEPLPAACDCPGLFAAGTCPMIRQL